MAPHHFLTAFVASAAMATLLVTTHCQQVSTSTASASLAFKTADTSFGIGGLTGRAGEAQPQRVSGTLGFCGLPGQACRFLAARGLTENGAVGHNIAAEFLRKYGESALHKRGIIYTTKPRPTPSSSTAATDKTLDTKTIPKPTTTVNSDFVGVHCPLPTCDHHVKNQPAWFFGARESMCGVQVAALRKWPEQYTKDLAHCCHNRTAPLYNTGICFRYCITDLTRAEFETCANKTFEGQLQSDDVTCGKKLTISYKSQAERLEVPWARVRLTIECAWDDLCESRILELLEERFAVHFLKLFVSLMTAWMLCVWIEALCWVKIYGPVWLLAPVLLWMVALSDASWLAVLAVLGTGLSFAIRDYFNMRRDQNEHEHEGLAGR